MSYQALLFCPDEKTARVVTQILSDLDFRVDPSNEPFAAVKKLMAQHFDAVVVDCENEQNAALLFKSARNSSTNQSSLSVAVVEGQAGVSKAFRLGANLVLTKPINVEQAKGTLRVARGLLRKPDPAKAGAPVATAPEPVAPPPAPSFKPAPPRAFPPAPAPPKMAAPVASASSPFEVEAEPTPEPGPAEAALLESMQDTAAAPKSVAPTAPAPPAREPWQPKPAARKEPLPLVSKGQNPELTFSAPRARELRPVANAPSSAQGAATAATPARETPRPLAKPLDLTPVKHEEAPAKKLSVTDPSYYGETSTPAPAIQVPTFGAAIHKEDSGNGKKIAIAAVVLVAVGAAGFFGWTKIHQGATPGAVQVATNQVPAGTTVVTPAGTTQPTTTASQPSSEAATSAAAAPEVAAPSRPKPTTQSAPEPPSSKQSARAQKEPIFVKGGSAGAKSAPVESVQAPSLAGVGADAQDLSGIMGASSVKMPTKGPAQQMLRISQGVSQGRITKKVTPVYPKRAVQMRIQGTVQLMATVSKEGTVTNVATMSGEEVLARAAMDAVIQWKYQPYMLNGSPIEFQTQVTVTFKLP